MAVSTEHTKDILMGNGRNTKFPFTFQVIDKKQIRCLKVLENGEEIEISNTEFDVNLSNNGANGGEITFPLVGNPLAEGTKFIIHRQTAIKQDYTPPNGQVFDAVAIKNEIDRLTMQNQEQEEQLERTVKTEMSSDVKPAELLADSVRKCASSEAAALSSENAAERQAEIANQKALDAEASAMTAINVVTGFDEHSLSKQNDFDNNVAEKTDFYNQNALLKVEHYNLNHNNAVKNYDENAASKQASVDKSASDAKASAIEAKQYRDEAEQIVSLPEASEVLRGVLFLANAEEAIAGVDDKKAMTAAKVTGVVNLHTNNKNNPHQVTKDQLGLGSVNNTADLDKPVSTSTKTYVDNLGVAKADINLNNVASETLMNKLIKKDVIDWVSGDFSKMENICVPNLNLKPVTVPKSGVVYIRTGGDQQVAVNGAIINLPWNNGNFSSTLTAVVSRGDIISAPGAWHGVDLIYLVPCKGEL